MSERTVEMRVRVLLSIQRALLGKVTPALRGVAVSWGEDWIAARFLYASDDPEAVELVRVAETEILADFADDVTTRFVVETVLQPTPLRLAADEIWTYLRRDT
jgi:hypothetical protein